MPKTGDLHSTQSAGIDSGKGLEVHINVESEPMITASFTNTESERRNLFAIYVYPRRADHTGRRQVRAFKNVDNGLLDGLNQAFNSDPRTLEVIEYISHQLAGCVIGDLTAAVGIYDRDVSR